MKFFIVTVVMFMGFVSSDPTIGEEIILKWKKTHKLELIVNHSALEPVIALQKLLIKLKGYHKIGNAKAMCKIFRNDGLTEFKKLALRITNPQIRKPFSDVVEYQT